MTLSGPMFEPADSGPWRSVFKKSGAHYNIYSCEKRLDGMDALREMFPRGANKLNVVLFSTSGVHGTYCTIEKAEQEWLSGVTEDGYIALPTVTFLIVHPRICCLRYGNCCPNSADDFAFLKRLRAESWAALAKIGMPAEGVPS